VQTESGTGSPVPNDKSRADIARPIEIELNFKALSFRIGFSREESAV